MKNHMLLGMLWIACVVVRGASPPRLIVRGDDMGYSHAGNEAIVQCSREGIQSSIEVIVPSPWFPEAVRLLTTLTNVDVGIHLCLSSEWDDVKWRPVSDARSIRDADGYFWPMIFSNKNYHGRSLSENPWKIEDIEKEFRAQIELGKRRIPRISHVSAHMGCSMIHAEVRALVLRLGAEYGVMVETGGHEVKSAGYQGPHRTSTEKIGSFIRMLEGLESGKTYLFVDHPGLDTSELRGIHHVGYENVAEDRQGVTDTFTSPKVREMVRSLGIELIGYRDLKR